MCLRHLCWPHSPPEPDSPPALPRFFFGHFHLFRFIRHSWRHFGRQKAPPGRGMEFELRPLGLDGDDSPFPHIHVLRCRPAIPNMGVAIAELKIRVILFRRMRSLAQSVHNPVVSAAQCNCGNIGNQTGKKEKVQSFRKSTCSVRPIRQQRKETTSCTDGSS